MHTIHNALKIAIIVGNLLVPFTTFSMRPNQNQQAECSICGKKNPSKTKGINETTIRWKRQRTYNLGPLPVNNYLSNSLESSGRGSTPRKERPSPRYGSPRSMFKSVPIHHTDRCSHNVCIECAEKSKNFDPDERGCQLCAYEQARAQHTQCNLNGCDNPANHVKQYIQHTHGLCNDHNNEITKLHTPRCNVCYAQENPDILTRHPLCEVCEKNTDHINVNASCIHHLCTACKNESDTLFPDDKGCKQCTYTEARIEHSECDIDDCDNPADRITGYGEHTHGLCHDHLREVTKIHTSGCNVCYAQENPATLDPLQVCEACKKNKTDHINVNTACKHSLCIACKNESDMLHPNAEGCKACTYIDAHLQHIQCDMPTCTKPTDHITGHKTHTHGLCNEHQLTMAKLRYHAQECKICYALKDPVILNQPRCEVCANNIDFINANPSCTHYLCNLHNARTMQFHYSPITYIKSVLQGHRCTTCFIKNNPEVTSCASETRCWAEIALLAGSAALVAYGAKRMYTWWKERKEKQEEEKEQGRSEEEKNGSISA